LGWVVVMVFPPVLLLMVYFFYLILLSDIFFFYFSRYYYFFLSCGKLKGGGSLAGCLSGCSRNTYLWFIWEICVSWLSAIFFFFLSLAFVLCFLFCSFFLGGVDWIGLDCNIVMILIDILISGIYCCSNYLLAIMGSTFFLYFFFFLFNYHVCSKTKSHRLSVLFS
jgi:hypothetical protein